MSLPLNSYLEPPPADRGAPLTPRPQWSHERTAALLIWAAIIAVFAALVWLGGFFGGSPPPADSYHNIVM